MISLGAGGFVDLGERKDGRPRPWAVEGGDEGAGAAGFFNSNFEASVRYRLVP